MIPSSEKKLREENNVKFTKNLGAKGMKCLVYRKIYTSFVGNIQQSSECII